MSYMKELHIELMETTEKKTALDFEVVSGVAYALWNTGIPFDEACRLVRQTALEHRLSMRKTANGRRGTVDIAINTGEKTETVVAVIEFFMRGGLSPRKAMQAAELLLLANKARQRDKKAVV